MMDLKKRKICFDVCSNMLALSKKHAAKIAVYCKNRRCWLVLSRLGKQMPVSEKSDICAVSVLRLVTTTDATNSQIVKETIDAFESAAESSVSADYSNKNFKKVNLKINNGLLPQPLGMVILIDIINNQINLYK